MFFSETFRLIFLILFWAFCCTYTLFCLWCHFLLLYLYMCWVYGNIFMILLVFMHIFMWYRIYSCTSTAISYLDRFAKINMVQIWLSAQLNVEQSLISAQMIVALSWFNAQITYQVKSFNALFCKSRGSIYMKSTAVCMFADYSCLFLPCVKCTWWWPAWRDSACSTVSSECAWMCTQAGGHARSRRKGYAYVLVRACCGARVLWCARVVVRACCDACVLWCALFLVFACAGARAR